MWKDIFIDGFARYGITKSCPASSLTCSVGEMHFIPSGPGSWFSLPRKNGVAFAAQESWVQNETIRVWFKLICPQSGLTSGPYPRTIFCSALHMMKNVITKVQIKILHEIA